MTEEREKESEARINQSFAGGNAEMPKRGNFCHPSASNSLFLADIYVCSYDRKPGILPPISGPTDHLPAHPFVDPEQKANGSMRSIYEALPFERRYDHRQ